MVCNSGGLATPETWLFCAVLSWRGPGRPAPPSSQRPARVMFRTPGYATLQHSRSLSSRQSCPRFPSGRGCIVPRRFGRGRPRGTEASLDNRAEPHPQEAVDRRPLTNEASEARDLRHRSQPCDQTSPRAHAAPIPENGPSEESPHRYRQRLTWDFAHHFIIN